MESEWSLKFYHHYSLEEISNMIVYERDIHVQKIVNHLRKMKEINEF